MGGGGGGEKDKKTKKHVGENGKKKIHSEGKIGRASCRERV